MLSVLGLPHKELRAEAYYYFMINTPNDMSSYLKQTAKQSDGRTHVYANKKFNTFIQGETIKCLKNVNRSLKI